MVGKTKKIIVNHIPFPNQSSDLIVLSKIIDGDNSVYSIEETPWKNFTYKPEVNFKILYTDNELLLKVIVNENYIRSKYNQPNDPVYRDSCFEFFISLDNDDSYYNFEFNCIGTKYLAFGEPGNNREKANNETVKSIQTFSTLGNEVFEEKQGNFEWELNVSIPFSAFYKHDISSLKGKTCRANFYKCGDDLSLPHFVSWNNIETKEPDFHRPEFFGELTFK